MVTELLSNLKVYLTADMKLEALYYSEERSTWEPLIEPVMECENSYRPWELLIKLFREQSYFIVSAQDSHSSKLLIDAVDGLDGVSHAGSCGSTSSSDDASETEMTVIRKQPPARPKRALSHKSKESSTLLAVDSDSETDENVLHKISQAFGHLFSDHSSEDDVDESEETEMADNELSTADDRPVFLEKGEARDGTQDSSAEAALATYILAESRDCLNVNVTSTALRMLFQLWNDVKEKKLVFPRNLHVSQEAVTIVNLLGPESLLSVLVKDASERKQSSFDEHAGCAEAASTPVSPFEEKPLSELYRERTKKKLSLEVPGFEKFQCWMPTKAGSSLFALHPMKVSLYFV
ncbi:hypothetical protein MTO96_021595 [Rhipicephalus appendiculatus]